MEIKIDIVIVKYIEEIGSLEIFYLIGLFFLWWKKEVKVFWGVLGVGEKGMVGWFLIFLVI